MEFRNSKPHEIKAGLDKATIKCNAAHYLANKQSFCAKKTNNCFNAIFKQFMFLILLPLLESVENN